MKNRLAQSPKYFIRRRQVACNEWNTITFTNYVRDLCFRWDPCAWPTTWWLALRPVYSDTTQLDSTRRRVELSCVGEVSIATPTQLNSTRLTYFALIGWTLFNWVSCIADRRRQLSCVGEGVYSDATQLNSTRRRVELSCVAINGP